MYQPNPSLGWRCTSPYPRWRYKPARYPLIHGGEESPVRKRSLDCCNPRNERRQRKELESIPCRLALTYDVDVLSKEEHRCGRIVCRNSLALFACIPQTHSVACHC